MSAHVSMVGGDKSSKALTEFMLNRRVDIPVNATAPGRPGDWSVDDEKLYMCLAQDDWFAVALAPVGDRSEVIAPIEDELSLGDGDTGDTELGEKVADESSDDDSAADDPNGGVKAEDEVQASAE